MRNKALVGLILMLTTWFGFASSQVIYGSPDEQDLAAYFYGGMNIVDIDFLSSSNLNFQVIDMRDMSVIDKGELQVSEAFSPKARAHFALSIASMPYCQNAIEGKVDQHYAMISVKADTYSIFSDNAPVASGGVGSLNCLAFPPEFNWGHWTDLLAFYHENIPNNLWVPVSAFVPNFNTETGIRDASAKDWLVLLILLGELPEHQEVALNQAQIIGRIKEYGINPNP